MRALFASSLLALPLLIVGQPAQAQYYNYQYRQQGNFGYGHVYGPNSYYGGYSHTRIGNFVNTNYRDNYGNTSCNTIYIGNYAHTSCY